MLFLAKEIGFVDKIMRQLMAFLCQLIYPLISWLYDLFMNISQVNILSTEDVQPIYQRVTLILTIVMVFYITFQFVKYVVQPDGITDKEKGEGRILKVLKRSLGKSLAEVVVEKCPAPIEMVAVRDTFGEVGKNAYLSEKFGLTTKDIISAAKRALARK